MSTRVLRPLIVLVLFLIAGSAAAQSFPKATVQFPDGASSVTVPFERHRDFIVISVEFEGVDHPLRMIVDTGAPVMVVADTNLTNQMNLQIWAQAQVGGSGDGQPRTAPLAGGVPAKVAGLDISNGMLLISGDVSDAIAGLDGIIGGTLFESTVAEIDWAKQTLTFHDPEHYIYEGDGAVLPLTMHPNRHVYTEGMVQVGGQLPVPVTLHVDTGSLRSLNLFLSADSPVQAPDNMISNTIVGWGVLGAARGNVGRIQKLQLGDYVLENVLTQLPEQTATPDAQGSIGIPIFERFHVILDYPHEQLILSANEHLNDPFPFSTTGLFFKPWAPGTSVLTVADVMAGSPAEEAGLAPGDQVTAIDKHPVAKLSVDALEALSELPPDTKLVLTVQREETILTKTLQTKQLL